MESSSSRICSSICSGERSDMTTTVANQQRRINLANVGQCRQIEAKCPGRDSETWTTERLPRLTQNRQCTDLSFVQAQHYRDALESRAIRKLNHKSEMVRIRLRGLEAFMRWVVDCFLRTLWSFARQLDAYDLLRC